MDGRRVLVAQVRELVLDERVLDLDDAAAVFVSVTVTTRRRSSSRGSRDRAAASRRAPPFGSAARRGRVSRRVRSTMMRPISRKSSSSIPRIVAAGVPMRTPLAIVGLPLVERNRVAVHGQLHLVQPLLGVLAGPVGRAEVELQQVRVGASGEHVEPAVHQRLRERVRIAPDLRLVVAERLRRGDLEARRLRRDRVLERAALHAREDRAVDCLRVLLPAEDEARARARRASCASSR